MQGFTVSGYMNSYFASHHHRYLYDTKISCQIEWNVVITTKNKDMSELTKGLKIETDCIWVIKEVEVYTNSLGQRCFGSKSFRYMVPTRSFARHRGGHGFESEFLGVCNRQ